MTIVLNFRIFIESKEEGRGGRKNFGSLPRSKMKICEFAPRPLRRWFTLRRHQRRTLVGTEHRTVIVKLELAAKRHRRTKLFWKNYSTRTCGPGTMCDVE